MKKPGKTGANKKQTWKKMSSSPEQTMRIAADFVPDTPGVKDVPLLFSLEGGLGSGKTIFVKGLARALGVKQTVKSPTYLLLHRYTLAGKWRGWALYHFDLYRLKSADQFVKEGFAGILRQPRSVIAIEWPGRIRSLLPPHALRLRFSQQKNTPAIARKRFILFRKA